MKWRVTVERGRESNENVHKESWYTFIGIQWAILKDDIERQGARYGKSEQDRSNPVCKSHR